MTESSNREIIHVKRCGSNYVPEFNNHGQGFVLNLEPSGRATAMLSSANTANYCMYLIHFILSRSCSWSINSNNSLNPPLNTHAVGAWTQTDGSGISNRLLNSSGFCFLWAGFKKPNLDDCFWNIYWLVASLRRNRRCIITIKLTRDVIKVFVWLRAVLYLIESLEKLLEWWYSHLRGSCQSRRIRAAHQAE